VTHPFVFEVKGTSEGPQLAGHHEQVLRYLQEGQKRIRQVVLTNLSGLWVYELDHTGSALSDVLFVDLRTLALSPTITDPAISGSAARFAQFISQYRFQVLDDDQKLNRVCAAPPWAPGLEITSTDWVIGRLSSVVQAIQEDVRSKVLSHDQLRDATIVPAEDRLAIERELRELEKRVGGTDAEVAGRSLEAYLGGGERSRPRLALQQFIAHTAFYTATRLLLVRAWEDSGLLESPALYNGGFAKLMEALDSISEVVDTALHRAGQKSPALFSRHNAFSWYRPSDPTYVHAIYELANTYLGDLSDDVLGDVYQQQLERLDRKQLGQYYTPRDIIKVIWDMVGLESLAQQAAEDGRAVRVLDIATGSGGFLVEGAARLRRLYLAGVAAGETQSARDWLTEVVGGLVACEVQQFSAYLAEVNFVLQFSPLLRGDSTVRIPRTRVHCVDTLSLYNPDKLHDDDGEQARDNAGVQNLVESTAKDQSLETLRDPGSTGQWLDAAVGNPPYVGEKSIAKTMADLQSKYPYWQQFSAAHQDYLYSFLILGVSKLRKGGRFGFITTEYWLSRTGATPLRRYLAKHCRIDRLILFRNLTLFPDAPGQHNLIVVGERVTDPDSADLVKVPTATPRVSIYTGPARPARACLLMVGARGGPRRGGPQPGRSGRACRSGSRDRATV